MEAQTNTFSIVIVGGGSAGCGVAASLLKRDPTLSIAIIEPSTQHYYQPAWTLVGAGEFEASNTVRDMADCIPKGVTWLKAAATTFDPDNNQVDTDHLGTVKYQYLIVCPGLSLNWDAIKGLKES